jgi:hypothetical protein
MNHVTTPDPPRVVVQLPLAALGRSPSPAHPHIADDAHAIAPPEGSGPADAIHDSLPVSGKFVLTAVLLSALLAGPYAHPALARFRLLEPKAPAPVVDAAPSPMPVATVGEASLPGETRDAPGTGEDDKPTDARGPIAHAAAPAPEPAKDVTKLLAHIEDPSGHALDTFYDKLSRAEKKEPRAVARILYYGDSIVGSDLVTAKLRRLYQGRFGDAGHGYAMLANAWPGWFHLGVVRSASAEWKVSRILGPYAADSIYGLGGVSFKAEKPGVWAKFATAESGEIGLSVSRFDLEYLAQPEGGDLSLLVDGNATDVLHTAADAIAVTRHTVKVPDGAHSLEIRSVGDRPVRAFGIRMERDVPGVSLSALGITGARARFLDKNDEAAWTASLRGAEPDLVILAFGSNETTDGMMYPLVEYEASLRALMKRMRAALPTASLMLVGPPDMATENTGTGHTRPTLPVLVKIQRKVAGEEGWAFFDQFSAMGGAGSMWWWIKRGMGSSDMFHPTESGGNQLGAWQFRAMMEAYDAFATRARP